jgi:pSer/pThr/pTyr-binding forkhead associated (FHA) protein
VPRPGKLVLTRGEAQPATLDLSQPTVRIGRSTKGNHIVVRDPRASSHHVEIRMQGEEHVIQDLNSTNGTLVNGKRLTDLFYLSEGDCIALGNTEWIYQRGGSPAATAPRTASASARRQKAPTPASTTSQPGRLVLVRGEAQPATLNLSQSTVRIGRSTKGNHIVVRDPRASSHHAEIQMQGEKHVIQDLNSTNGTLVNSNRLTDPLYLSHGDRITLGNTEWIYQRGGSPAAVPQH